MLTTTDTLRRYARQTQLPELGVEGQTRLGAARVLMIGAGGLASPAALYLAAAGVGRIGLVDFDLVDETNLHRQVLYATSDVGHPKLTVAAARLRALNPHVEVDCYDQHFNAENGRALVDAYDLVIDGTDNFPTRYLINDACVMAGKPNVYGSISRFEGQASVFAAEGGPCYRCLHPEPPPAGLIPNCAEGGVLGVLPGIIGTLQATEAIKIITGMGEPLVGRLLLYDALKLRFREIALTRDPACPVCGDAPTITELVEYDRVCEPVASDLTADELYEWRVAGRPHVLLDVREPWEHAIAYIDGAELVPVSRLQSRIMDLPIDKPIVIHCQTGGRSAKAVSMLRARGYDARNLAGGLKAWVELRRG
jgi:molybdopterin/thiamine biosynthesis adenylyltransferase/rhodanese-related sulfurtransferase